MTTAAIYARVSTEGQRKNKSLEHQIDKCRQYAQSLAFEVSTDHEFYDVFTGTKLQRPAFDRVKDVAGKVDAIIFHVADRLSRADVLDSVQQIRWFEEHGTQVHITNRGRVDTKDEMALIILILELSSARKERDDIVRRTSDGRLNRVKKSGKLMMGSTVYYGYDYHKDTGQVTINETEAAWVRKIFYWHGVERLGYLSIAQRLQAANVPTRHDVIERGKIKKGVRCHWQEGTLSKMVKSTIYKGQWTYKRKDGQTATVEVPAIVDNQLWEQCQEVSRSNRTSNNTGGQTYPALLTGRIKCRTCGRTFQRNHDNTRGSDLRSYKCPGQVRAYSSDGKTQTCHGSFNLYTVDAQVWDALVDALRNPANIIAGFKADKEAKLAESQYDRDHLHRCKIEVTKLDSAIARQRQMFTFDETYPEDEYKRTVANLNYQRQLQLDKIAELESRLDEQLHDDMSIEAFERYCEQISEDIDIFTAEDKRRLIEALNVQATITRGPDLGSKRGRRATGTLSLTAIVPLDIEIQLIPEVADLALTS